MGISRKEFTKKKVRKDFKGISREKHHKMEEIITKEISVSGLQECLLHKSQKIYGKISKNSHAWRSY